MFETLGLLVVSYILFVILADESSGHPVNTRLPLYSGIGNL